MLLPKKLIIIALLGMISGFTLMISGNSLNFWLAKEGEDVTIIGIFTLVSLPYAINFIWAPLFDYVKLPFLSKKLGHRLSWIFLLHILLSINIYILSINDPKDNLWLFAMIATGISFLASAQDSVMGALKTEIIHKNQQPAVSGIYIFGYRIGMLLSSSGAIYLSIYVKWAFIYKIFSLSVVIFSILLISLARKVTIKPTPQEEIYLGKGFFASILKPIGTTSYLLMVLLFLILYRLPDNFISAMINPFLLHIGYNEYDIAIAGKLFGVVSALIGGFIASSIMQKSDILRSLLLFGAIHTISHTMFIVQEAYGKNLYLLFFVTGFESITSGMTMAAYIAFIASLCKGNFRATQYAFFSSMMGVSRAILPAVSGLIVASFNWQIFYLFVTIISLPPLAIIYYWRRKS